MAVRSRLAWAYDREHMQHPFIVLALDSLASAGWDVVVIAADRVKGRPYASLDSFSFEHRKTHWSGHQHALARLRKRMNALNESNVKLSRDKRIHARWLAAYRRWLLQLRLFAASWELSARKALAMIRRDTIDSWLPYLRGFRCLMAVDADIFVASRPEASIYAAMAAKLRGRPFIYYPFELYGDQFAKPNRFIQAAERVLLRFAVDGLVTQNEMRAKVYIEERGARVTPAIVHNYKEKLRRAVTPRLRVAHPQFAGTKIVLYEGQLVDGRWLDRLAQASLHLPDDVVIVMLGPEKGNWLKKAEESLREPLRSGRLFVLPAAPHDELPGLIADADLGVIIYDDSVRNNVYCEPGKLIDYISVGVPVVAPDFPTIGPVIRRCDIGVCFSGSEPQQIAEAIKLGLKREKAQWKTALDAACRALNWEAEFPKLLGVVENCLRVSRVSSEILQHASSDERSALLQRQKVDPGA